jgi:thiol:disulfide interchange protein DsbD
LNFRLFLLFFIWIFSSPVQAIEASSSSENALFIKADTEVLTPDQAFRLEIQAQDQHTLKANFTIAKGHYLYRDKIKFEAKDFAIESRLPQGDIKKDTHFGEVEVYHNGLIATIAVNNLTNNQTVHIKATYQGCSEKGLCYSPIHKSFQIDLRGGSADDQATTLLKSGKFWLIVIGFFGFGVLLALTPCVLPMIPILSGIIVGDKKVHHHATSRLHAFNLSLAYTLGMSLSYTLAGIAAGLSGQLLSNALQSSWMLGATALIFVFLAFSMFGFYELRLPSAMENRMVNIANGIKGGQFIGVFSMGALSALVVSPCVAAPLAGALIYIGQTHDVVLGGVALFSLSIGMGIPLLLIGASAGHVLPKAGPWMTAVRNFFGLLMLAMAIYLISPAIPTSIQMLLWAALLIIPAIYLRAIDQLPSNATPAIRLWKGLGLILLVLGVTMIIGAASGAKSPLHPLSGLINAQTNASTSSLSFKRIHSIAELEANIQSVHGKTVMLDFYADWCVACKELEQFTFSDTEVKNALKDTVLLQADVTNNSAEDIALLNRFKLFGPPGIVFFNKDGQEVGPLKVVGYQPPEEFIKTLQQVASLGANECNPSIAC